MKIAIIGTGNVGGTFASKWAHAGNEIHLGVKDSTNFKGKELLQNPNTQVHSITEAVSLSEIIFNRYSGHCVNRGRKKPGRHNRENYH